MSASRARRLGVRAAARTAALGFAAAQAPAWAQLVAALRDPHRTQLRVLARIRGHTARASAYRAHGLGRVRTLAEWQRALPLCTYDDVAPAIARAADGERDVLSTSPIARFERSGGSSGAQKLLPLTRAFLAEMNAGLGPWLCALYADPHGAARGAAYWSISPLSDHAQVTSGGIPIGATADSAYFPWPLRALLDTLFAVPSAVGHLSSIEVCRYATLRFLLARDDLAFISVWSPTFLSLLMDALHTHGAALVRDLHDGTCTPPHATAKDQRVLAALALSADAARSTAVERALAANDTSRAVQLWPRLSVLSLWTEGSSAPFVDDVRTRFPGVRVQGKGLLAVEGVTSVPFGRDDDACVAASTAHLIELIDTAHPHDTPRLLHEAEDGGTYEVVLSTSAGLLRYRTGDLVRVAGRAGNTPRLRFLGRNALVSDLVGEKLSAAFVGDVLAACAKGARFCMLAPERVGVGARYAAFVEDDSKSDSDLSDLAHAIDAALSAGHPYRYARELGQLQPVRVQRVRNGARAYEAGCTALGQRVGDIKPLPLHKDLGWARVFASSPAGAPHA